MEVVRTTPQASPFSFTLGTGVVRIPLLALEALADGIARLLSLSIPRLDTPVKLIAQVDTFF